MSLARESSEIKEIKMKQKSNEELKLGSSSSARSAIASTAAKSNYLKKRQSLLDHPVTLETQVADRFTQFVQMQKMGPSEKLVTKRGLQREQQMEDSKRFARQFKLIELEEINYS